MPSKPKTLFWFLTIDPDVRGIHYDTVYNLIEDVLTSPRGWARKGYEFIPVPPAEGRYWREIHGHVQEIFHIRVSTPETIEKDCDFSGLNCARLDMYVAYIHAGRWLYGSVESQMDLDSYRRYIVSHEIGHLLGRNHHKKCEHGLSPVMSQQTLGQVCKPNPWPLDYE